MRSSTPRRAYLRSAFLALPQRQRYQNKLASPRELCLRTSRTKDDLINALYREIKLELADAMMSDFPGKKKVGTRLRHVWDRYVNWGIANPKQRKELAQLQVSEVLTKESRDAGSVPFVEFQIMIRDAIEQRVFRNDLPVELISKSLAACGRGDDRPYGVEPIQSETMPG